MQAAQLIQERRSVADNAYADFDFGLSITDSNAWDDTHSEDWRKVCYADDNGETARLVLHALFAPGSAELIEVYALDLASGQMVGNLVASPLERAEALGFATVEEMEEHQRWQDAMNRHQQQVSAAIRAAGTSPIIDLRNVVWPA